MKSIRSRTILVLVLIGLGIYYLYPTFKYESLSTKEDLLLTELAETSNIPLKRLASEIYLDDVDLKAEVQASELSDEQKAKAVESIEYLRSEFYKKISYYRPKAIKLGLDLQGGMYIVLEVDFLKLIDDAAKGKDETYDRIIAELRRTVTDRDVDVFVALREIAVREKTSLSRYWGDPGQSDDAILSELEDSADDAINRALEILRNRVDQFGVSEPSITKLGARRIALELPGVKDPLRARELVGRTALLEFQLLIEPERAREILTRLDEVIAADLRGESLDDTLLADTTTADSTAEALAADTAAADTGVVRAEELFAEEETAAPGDSVDTDNPLLSLLVGGTADILVPAENRSQVTRYLSTKEYTGQIPSDIEFIWSSKSRVLPQDGREYWTLFMVKRVPEMTGATLADANASMGSGYDPEQAGKPIVTMKMTREGGRRFSVVTGGNVGRRLGIVLDNKVFMAPNIRDKIPGGNAVITGLDDMEEARDIAIVLRAGALPAPVHIIEERTVGPSLGHDSVEAGKLSLMVAFLAVTLFMLWYYRASGGIADVAMILNIFLLLAILGMFQFTLTMPGIAGIILTMGMAVDANVLIFERIREELRLGKTVRAAVDTGFSRAIVTIVDANITTAIAGIVLLIYGTGPIKGFALTLTVGIAVNLFAAIVFTRLIYDSFTERRQLKRLSI